MTKKINNRKKSDFGLLRFLFWFGFGFSIGLGVPWYFYLQSLINSTFVQYSWNIPTSIYAREFEFYEGKKINVKELDFELEVLGYLKRDKPQFIGEYSVQSNSYEIHSKGFYYFDQPESPRVIKFEVVNHKIQNLNHQFSRLEPLVIGQFYNADFKNREPILIEHIPNTMVMGLQAIEDRSFNQHIGVDFLGILRAIVKNLFAGKVVQGGSTITQQLIKSRWNYGKKSWFRKANEAFSSILLERKLSKGEILENYFNEIYWGQAGKVSIHGVLQASQYYFSKKPKQLNIAEQALLIGLVKGPSWYNPINNYDRALKRRNTVLSSWYETGVISQTQWQHAKQSRIELRINNSFKNQKYRDAIDLVENQIDRHISDKELRQKGLKIFTTLNPFIHEQLVNTLRWHTNSLGGNLQSASVIANSQNGEILAIKGSKEIFGDYNRALLSKRQIGSLIKPFVYLAALEKLKGFELSDKINDKPVSLKTQSGEIWNPKNWDHKSLGKIKALDALVFSRNQATVNLGLKIGLNQFIRFLNRIGLNINHSNHPSIFLGATELTPLEVLNLYLLFSSNTEQKNTIFIKSIIDLKNTKIGAQKQSAKQNVDRQSLLEIREALHEVTTRGTASKVSKEFGFTEVYGKTGTTNDGRNSWYVGFDEDYLAIFWVGKDDNSPTTLSGASGAMKLWLNWYQKLR